MASKRPCAGVEELEKELQKLKLENKTLKKQLIQQAGPDDEILTPSQKDALITSVVNKLTKQADEKIRIKVTKDLLPLVTKKQCMEAITILKYRIDVSTDEPQDRPKRSVSKLRAK
uniref:Uncharacterized protein n=1 Tax=Saimiriine herpesvirus 2 TaxID=10381 RepID=Q80BJ0_SHV2|nr:hypothetical protein [Saimiriine gammaherpesvirus 2]